MMKCCKIVFFSEEIRPFGGTNFQQCFFSFIFFLITIYWIKRSNSNATPFISWLFASIFGNMLFLRIWCTRHFLKLLARIDYWKFWQNFADKVFLHDSREWFIHKFFVRNSFANFGRTHKINKKSPFQLGSNWPIIFRQQK